MIHYLSLLAYGDNLISLSLLARLQERARISVVGTGLTRAIASLLPGFDIPIRVVSDGIPAFYDLRKKGVRRGVDDWRSVVTDLSREFSRDDVVLVEKADFRSALLSRTLRREVHAPQRWRNVYLDRRDLLQQVLGEGPALEPAPRPAGLPRRVVINPASRVREKAVAPTAVSHLVTYLKRHGAAVTLIDPDREHASLQRAVDSYQSGTTLAQAVDLVRGCDLYLGADSLFVHFAYLFKVPFLVLFNASNLYFAPPGVEEAGAYLTGVSHLSERELFAALDDCLAG